MYQIPKWSAMMLTTEERLTAEAQESGCLGGHS
jgi:hypothetical protein